MSSNNLPPIPPTTTAKPSPKQTGSDPKRQRKKSHEFSTTSTLPIDETLFRSLPFVANATSSNEASGPNLAWPFPTTLSFVSSSKRKNNEELPLINLADCTNTQLHAILTLSYKSDEAYNKTNRTTTSCPFQTPALKEVTEKLLNPLLGFGSDKLKGLASELCLSYYRQSVNQLSSGLPKPPKKSSSSSSNNTAKTQFSDLPSLLNYLTTVAEESGTQTTFRPSPCGYAFRSGDLAWNCRTCQSDPSCVQCDDCFHKSDHDGHEVLFHRASPGGCKYNCCSWKYR